MTRPPTPHGAVLSDDPPSIPVAFVTGGYLEALHARAAAGRILATADAGLAARPVVVVSHAFSTRHPAGDRATVGRTLRIGRVMATIVGIAERRFAAPFTNGTGLWMPFSTYHVVHSARRSMPDSTAGRRCRPPCARCRPSRPRKPNSPRLRAVRDFQRSCAARRRAVRPADRLGTPGSQQFAVAVAVLTVIALVLLLACVNVASVLLANATTRQREIGVRLALGATRGRIVRQLLTESCVIATAASSTGLILTTWLAPMLARLTRAPATLDLGFDGRIYLFFVIVAIACGIVAGLAPSRIGGSGGTSSHP